jgi:hypothetical protein
MLGGLARWLRAAGYEAAWEEGINDADLVRRCLASGRVLLSSDRALMECGAIRSGRVRALLVPHGLAKVEQLRFVMRELALARREPRCMACGGVLVAIPKEAARPEAPPRTYAWCTHFYRCSDCARLFWQGTHWHRIQEALESI